MPDVSRKKATTAQERIGFVDVPELLESPHPLIRKASKRLTQKAGWDDLQRTAFQRQGEIFAFEVTRDAIDRALLIGDTLIKALERQGMKVSVKIVKRVVP